MKEIYVLHEYGAPNHFTALEFLASENDAIIFYREFSIIKDLVKAIIKHDYRLFKKQLVNIIFIFNLLFSKNKNIIIGIAPYDFRLVYLRILLKCHNSFYFTSWTNWKGDYYPKKILSKNNLIQKSWKSFIEKDIKGLFCVTNSSLDSISSMYRISCTTSVVYHSVIEHKVSFTRKEEDITRLIFVGRLDRNKGIDDLLNLMQILDNEKYHLTIIGDGEYKNKVIEFTKQYKNTKYLGYISSKEELYKEYKKIDIQLLFSRKHDNWQEVFGMVIIEAMYNSVPTISTNHSGPFEIITNNVNGCIIEDDENIVESVGKLLSDGNIMHHLQKSNLKKYATKYYAQNLSEKWGIVLQNYL